METIIIFINHFFDILWWPLYRIPPYVGIIIISAISALIFLIIFKKTSNQEMIKRYKNRMVAHILEIRLYKDQPSLTLKSIFKIIWFNIIYLRFIFPSMIVVLLPFLIISVQINNRYGYAPLEIGKPFIMRVDLSDPLVRDMPDIWEKIRSSTSGGIQLETVPLVVSSQASIFWRARVIGSEEEEQFFKITVDGTDDTVEKEIHTKPAMQRFSPKRTKWHVQNLLLNNAEDFIPQRSSVESVRVTYERASYPFLLWNIDAIILYFLLTMILAFLFKPVIKVTF